MSLCLIAAGKTTLIAASAFTLSWTHSVERTRWQEDWRVLADGLQIVEARIKGSGAGMEPPEGSRLVGGWWVYEPKVGAMPALVLAASGATPSGWSLCTDDGACREIGTESAEPITLKACSASNSHAP